MDDWRDEKHESDVLPKPKETVFEDRASRHAEKEKLNEEVDYINEELKSHPL